MKGSDRNFEASQTERYRKTKKDRRVGVCTKERKGITAAKPQIELGDDDVYDARSCFFVFVGRFFF